MMTYLKPLSSSPKTSAGSGDRSLLSCGHPFERYISSWDVKGESIPLKVHPPAKKRSSARIDIVFRIEIMLDILVLMSPLGYNLV